MPQSSLNSPIGVIRIVAADGRLVAITIGDAAVPAGEDDALTRAAAVQLAEWFAGARTTFMLPLAPARTPRGAALRAGLEAIGHGHTTSYGEVARRIGSGARAVGQACARNPFPIVVPCHRILAASGAIGHYSAGAGIETKRWLLDHERRKDQ